MSNQVDEVEAVATFSLEVGINQGILQGDSIVVMKFLVDEAQPLASFGTFINGLFGLRGREGECIYIHTHTHSCIWSILPFVLYS